MKRLLAAQILVGLGCFVVFASRSLAAEGTLWTTLPVGKRSRPATLADLAERARSAVVHVRGTAPAPADTARGGRRQRDEETERVAIGTGFVINRDGYVVTNEHVIRGVTGLRIRLYDGRELSACVVGADLPTDIALLQVRSGGPFPVLPLGDSDAVRVGQPVIAIGNPFGFNNSVTAGIVSAKERVVDRATLHQLTNADAYSFFIQTDASINLGNSGGPLIDDSGQVIGVNAAFWSGHPLQPAQGIGFAIPINMAKALLPRLRASGAAPRSYLGVDAQPLDAALASALKVASTRGALLASVEKGSPAEEGGLEAGDVVVTWGKLAVATSEDFKIDAQLTAPGTRVRVGIIRDGQRLDREVALRAAPLKHAPEPHPSACRGLADARADAAGDELVVTELPAGRATNLPGGRGVSVAEAPPHSPAADAGLQVGDIILRIGKDAIREPREVTASLKASRAEVVPLLVRRSGYDFWVALRRGR